MARSFYDSGGVPDLTLKCVMNYIEDPCDRAAVSRVCWRWHAMDCETRKHVTIPMCYTATPDILRRRFPNLESLKLKGKPRSSMFEDLTPDDWGGIARPWISGLVTGFDCLRSIHLRRMIVLDQDIDVLVRERGPKLQSLTFHNCYGFSSDGLYLIAKFCRCLRALSVCNSLVIDKDGRWLHEFAVNHSFLETFNFYLTDLENIALEDLELIAKNCKSLKCLKVRDIDISDLLRVFNNAKLLEELVGASFDGHPNEPYKYERVCFPPGLCSLGLMYMTNNNMHILYPLAAKLKKLDLQFALLSTDEHCELIQRCPNLEILQARFAIGDRGLEVVSQTCKKLKRLRVEHGDRRDEVCSVSQVGLCAVAQGCPQLQYFAIHVCDITNLALERIGIHSKNLRDFRLVLVDQEVCVADLPLDNGVRALLTGCDKLKSFTLCLRPGALTDVGLRYIGENSSNISRMLLGWPGESDEGIFEFVKGCPAVQKLELRGCCFSEQALALATKELKSLRYIKVWHYRATCNGSDLLLMDRPFWNIEFIPPRPPDITYNEDDGEAIFVTIYPAQFLAYYSLVGRKADYPDTTSVDPLYSQ